MSSFNLEPVAEQVAILTERGWSIAVVLDQPSPGEINFRGLRAHRNLPGGCIDIEVFGIWSNLKTVAKDLVDLCDGVKVTRHFVQDHQG